MCIRSTCLGEFGCSAVSDVSALDGVHTLNLFRCSGVSDVSALGGAYAKLAFM